MRISWITIDRAYRRADGAASSDLASIRYRVLSPIQAMAGRGQQHRVIQMVSAEAQDVSDRAVQADVLIFSKSLLGENEDLAARAQRLGIPVVFDICDNHFGDPNLGGHYRRMIGLADLVICNTAEMARAARDQGAPDTLVIEDPFEGPKGVPGALAGDPMRLLWFGHRTNLDSLRGAVRDLYAYAGRRRISLTVLTELSDEVLAYCAPIQAAVAGRFEFRLAPWSLDAQWAALAACDAVIIPCLQTEAKRVKSANRMIEALWAGRPVAAQPMPAYAPFAEWAAVRDTLSEGLEQLVKDREALPGVISAAQRHIVARYSPAVIGQAWAEAIENLVASHRAPE